VADAAIKEPEPSKQRRGSGDVAGERGASQAAWSRPANGWDALCNRVSNKDRWECLCGEGNNGQYACNFVFGARIKLLRAVLSNGNAKAETNTLPVSFSFVYANRSCY
jgi:hypothetical protein